MPLANGERLFKFCDRAFMIAEGGVENSHDVMSYHYPVVGHGHRTQKPFPPAVAVAFANDLSSFGRAAQLAEPGISLDAFVIAADDVICDRKRQKCSGKIGIEFERFLCLDDRVIVPSSFHQSET